ncbi:helicase-associated domain-containing protein [Parafrigoribacterium soli]|uniref:helicase-associated domain-containing protein n=1 Tax=Parafrigoribacterium soli TaxID=3144663 RepID=UPI0032EE404C
MSSVLALASRLRGMSNTELVEAVRRRGFSTTGIKDFFDLAEAFLAEASVQQTLSRLERPTLAVLAAAGSLAVEGTAPSTADVASQLRSLGARTASPESVAARAAECAELLLAAVEGDVITVYDSVREKLAAWPSLGLPGEAELASAPQPASLGSVPDTDRRFVDRLAADRAFATTTAITELLTGLEHEPARELSRGGIALPDSKRLASAMSVDLDAVPVHLAVADRAALVAREGNTWMVTEAGASWLLQPSSTRWVLLSAAWLDALPGDIRHLLSERTRSLWGSGLRGYIDWLYPAGGDWMDERVSAGTVHAELLGITANNAPSSPGSLLLAGKTDAAASSMAALLPPEVEQVYLQHDLSVVAPGPLTPEVDARLRSLADVENRSLASTYRISASSLNRAMAAGESAESLLEFLGGISLTGIPQPLDYLIAETAQRYGLVRAGELHDTVIAHPAARSYLRSDDADLLSAIAVDQSLSALGLIRVSSSRILARCDRDVLFWAVSEARYPVAAEDADGSIVSLRRHHSTRVAVASAPDPVDALIERLRLGESDGDDENDQAWLVRQLEVAIRSKAALTVTITMPNGTDVDYQLEPTSLGGGRLRARDRKSAIERTLPLSSISGIAPAL